ncbi:MAG TPA: hypothetical protein VFB62_04230 [Polyangiaceae bacterium]|nr:hypothetical protein [Polyangiaceae bacterium]
MGFLRVRFLLLAALVACSGSATVDGSSGSGGSSASQSASRSASSGGNRFGACDGPGQCTLAWPGCCAGCNTPTLADLVPVAFEHLTEFQRQQCPAPEPCPGCVGCPNGELFAYCDSGQCTGTSLSQAGLTECMRTAECKLRWGSSCYEECGGPTECGTLTAINIEAEGRLAQMVCDPDMPPPPPCVPTYPDNARAECVKGRCMAIVEGP